MRTLECMQKSCTLNYIAAASASQEMGQDKYFSIFADNTCRAKSLFALQTQHNAGSLNPTFYVSNFTGDYPQRRYTPKLMGSGYKPGPTPCPSQEGVVESPILVVDFRAGWAITK